MKTVMKTVMMNLKNCMTSKTEMWYVVALMLANTFVVCISCYFIMKHFEKKVDEMEIPHVIMQDFKAQH